MLLKRLEIRNVRKVKQADIEFHGAGVQVIQGLNKSGKTTIAQSIAVTLGGAKEANLGMVTMGEESAEIIAYTDDGLKIKTSIKDKVTQDVQRLDELNGRYTKVSGGVREFLNSLRSGLEMPWSMKDLPDYKIIEILKEKTGISGKIEEIDRKIKRNEECRTDTGRDIKKIGTVAPVPEAKHPDPIDELIKLKNEAVRQREAHTAHLDMCSRKVRESVKNITMVDDYKDIIVAIDRERAAFDKYIQTTTVPSAADVEAIDQKIFDWHKAEAEAAKYEDYVKKIEEKTSLEQEYANLTAEIDNLRQERKAILSKMSVGVKGLEITEDNLLSHNGAIRGITDTNKIGNWSTAESIQVFFSLGALFAGPIKTLVVDNAESLDRDTTAAISKWAEKSAFLVILLKVGDVPENLEEGIIYIKDGEIVGAKNESAMV